MALIFFLLVFLVYWFGLLFPTLKSTYKNKAEIKQVELLLQRQKAALQPASSNQTALPTALYPREEQLSRFLNFIDEKFKFYGIKLISLQQSADKNKLTINLKFESSYYQFLGFLNSLPELKTLLVIDSVNASQKESKMIVEMRIISGYL